MGVRDRMAAPESLAAEVNALVQKTMSKYKKFENKTSKESNNDKSTMKCYYCNELGHYKSECPKLRGNKGSKFEKKNTWKYRAPNAGEPQSKMVDGTEYHWCSKCCAGR